MNSKGCFVAFIGLSLCVGIILGIHFNKKANDTEKIPSIQNVEQENLITDEEPEVVTPVKEKIVRDDIKAIYLTGWSAGTKQKRESCISALKENNFNAVVIDIKDEAGRLSYNSNVQTAIDIGASQKMISNISEVIDDFKENGIYVIGRIVTFKDPLYAKKFTNIAYKKEDGSLWTDYSNNNWPNPYNPDSWEYPISLAKEACELGFDEIQFDYVRFPSSEGKVKQIAYGFESGEKTKADMIVSYLTKAVEELEEYKVVVSADVFGIITKRTGDFENIGQDFQRIAQVVDVICPMVYPSHYASGEYKLSYPDKSPYETIYYSIGDALSRYEEVTSENADAKLAVIRPYLQDFTATWLGKGKYLTYSTNEVKDQIQACYDLRINSFTLWDPNNKYCYDALNSAYWMTDEEYEEKLLQERLEKERLEQEKLEKERLEQEKLTQEQNA